LSGGERSASKRARTGENACSEALSASQEKPLFQKGGLGLAPETKEWTSEGISRGEGGGRHLTCKKKGRSSSGKSEVVNADACTQKSSIHAANPAASERHEKGKGKHPPKKTTTEPKPTKKKTPPNTPQKSLQVGGGKPPLQVKRTASSQKRKGEFTPWIPKARLHTENDWIKKEVVKKPPGEGKKPIKGLSFRRKNATTTNVLVGEVKKDARSENATGRQKKVSGVDPASPKFV